MEPRLTRGEYWILESLVDYRFAISLLSYPDLDQAFNKTAHGLSTQGLIDTLSNLFSAGWITAHIDGEPEKHRTLTRDEIATALNHVEPWWLIGLTAAGGATWEAFAAPEWDRFLETSYDPDEPRREIVAGSSKVLKMYFPELRHRGVAVVPGTERWDEIRPWQATYWKTLPAGYRVSFECRDIEGPSWDKVPHSVMALETWWVRWR